MSEKTQLCKCNNCDTVMFDENPSEQPLLTAPKGTSHMVQLKDEGEFFWACPECQTDEYLQDLQELPDSGE